MTDKYEMSMKNLVKHKQQIKHKPKPRVYPTPVLNFTEFEQKLKEQKFHIQRRDDFLKNQMRVNYMNEYDRLKGSIANNTMPGLREDLVKQRMNKLKKLTKDLSDEKHEIYEK